jgi:transcriptional repressor of cell division inhibition gene dicB
MTKTDAVALFGSNTALAAALGISQAAVAQWGETMPLLRQYQVREILAARSKGLTEAQLIALRVTNP